MITATVVDDMLAWAGFAVLAWCGWRMYCAHRRRKIYPEPRCGGCGYIVLQLKGADCPECGRDLRKVGVVPAGRGGINRARLAIWSVVAIGIGIAGAVWGDVLIARFEECEESCDISFAKDLRVELTAQGAAWELPKSFRVAADRVDVSFENRGLQVLSERTLDGRAQWRAAANVWQFKDENGKLVREVHGELRAGDVADRFGGAAVSTAAADEIARVMNVAAASKDVRSLYAEIGRVLAVGQRWGGGGGDINHDYSSGEIWLFAWLFIWALFLPTAAVGPRELIKGREALIAKAIPAEEASGTI